MKPSFNAEALAFAIAWAALALVAGLLAGWQAGAILSVGLMLVIMPASTFILTRTDNFRTERLVRWSILVVAAAIFLFWRIN